jgi:hypothetical protein
VTLLAAKILLAPLCVVAVSLAGRRWGVAVTGVLGGRIATAAGGPVPSLLCGWTAFLLGVAVLSPLQPPPALSLILVAACFALGLRLLPPAPPAPPATAVPPWWDLPARARAALGLVLAPTPSPALSAPHLSGLLAPFPTALPRLPSAAAFGLAAAAAPPCRRRPFSSARASCSRPRPPRVAARTSSGADVGREVLAGEGGAGGDEVGRRALEDDPAAVVAGAGAEVDDPVGVRHDRLVVLDDDDRLAGADQSVE